jgi:uncharacterized membrane protein
MNTRLLIASALAAATVSGAVISAVQAAAPAAPSAPGAAAPAAPVTLTPAQIRAGFTPASIGHSVATPTAYKAEKCYGIAAAGLNDCAAKGSHSCAGTATLDKDPFSWVYVPAGYCERIAGSKLAPPA